jgi:ubiquinone/menaquinone biosynthesis C-methylase UbiE
MYTEKRDFDKESASWDENPARVKLAQDVARAILSRISITREMDVMDFGCGTGLLTFQILPFVQHIIGVDSSPGMLDKFNRKAATLKMNNIKAVLVDLEKGDTLSGHFNLVLTSMTLHHLKEIKSLIRQFFRITAPGGYLVIADLDPDDGYFHGDNTGVFHFGFERSALSNILIDAGYRNVNDIDAAEVIKPHINGESKRFSVFLITGQKTPDNTDPIN